MKHAYLIALLAAAATVTFAANARAQSCTEAGVPGQCSVVRTMQLTAQRTIQITVSPTTVNFGNPTASDYNQGFTQSLSAQTMTVNANNPWTLTITSGQANWTNSGSGSRSTKPRGDLSWSLTAGGSYAGMTGSAASLGSGNATNGTVISVFYRVAWAWTLDTPGVYTLPITLVLTAP